MVKRNESWVISRRAGRWPNALKHGAFCQSEVLPGEDPREFEHLVNAVFAEWLPSGPVEEDAACSIALAIWRKQRLSTFVRAQRARARYGKILEGEGGDKQIVYVVRWADQPPLRPPDEAQNMTTRMREVEDKFKQFEREQATAELLRDYIEQNPIPKVALATRDSVQSDTEEALVDVELAALGELISPEQFLKRTELEQRLDAKIDRAVKRLLQLKAMKPIVGLGPQSQTALDGKQRALPRPETPEAEFMARGR